MQTLRLAVRVMSVAGLLVSVTGGALYMKYKDDPVVMEKLQAAAIAQYGGENAGEIGNQVSRAGELMAFLGNTPSDAENPEDDLAAWYAADAAVEETDPID